MLVPRKVKYRKQFRGRRRGVAHRGNTVQYGEFGLQATEAGWITSNQIEAARVAITRHMRRGGGGWGDIFSPKAGAQKPAGGGLGGGKGAPGVWGRVGNAGRAVIEGGGVAPEVAKEALRLASHKLPVGTKIIERARVAGGEAT
ncbi:MAG: 50S ribosomal protein L16 [Bacillota bacterium]|nr:MAG: 50S ribosomal protein L16 [Bacillota bacterium]